MKRLKTMRPIKLNKKREGNTVPFLLNIKLLAHLRQQN